MIGEKSGLCAPFLFPPLEYYMFGLSNLFVCETKRNSIPAQGPQLQGVASPLIHRLLP
jgi:hypothetical protein